MLCCICLHLGSPSPRCCRMNGSGNRCAFCCWIHLTVSIFSFIFNMSGSLVSVLKTTHRSNILFSQHLLCFAGTSTVVFQNHRSNSISAKGMIKFPLASSTSIQARTENFELVSFSISKDQTICSYLNSSSRA